MVFGTFTVLDIKIVFEKARTPSREAVGALFLPKEPLQRFMLGDDCETL